jgi:hypothetical protein
MLQFSRVNSYDILFLIGTDNETDSWETGGDSNFIYKRQTFRDHIISVYTIYKKFLNNQLNKQLNIHNEIQSNLSTEVNYVNSTNQFAVNLLLMQGKNYIDRSIKIEFNRKKNKNLGPSSYIKLQIDPEIKFEWPENYNTFKLIESNFQVLENGLGDLDPQ